MLVIGVTGGICSGKSTVVSTTESIGAKIIDADKLGHQTYVPGTICYENLVKEFGSSIVSENGEINRRALGSLVFSDPSKMLALNSIVWPEIRVLIENRLQELEGEGAEVVVLEAAVMIEAGWQDLVTTLWVVGVDREVARDRLMKRNSLSEVEALKRIDSQISNEERCGKANLVIENNDSGGSLDEFQERVRELYRAEIDKVG
mmetsp:Transcript_22288/g.37285  ORF Transcript_22288/g.37285 Transcript_22288/m.37285 type:complete len:204 (-) Transcript_22288:133-744(-)